MPQRVALVPYDPRWPAAFESERSRLSSALGAAAVGIHHVGSTAVPGMTAKPVIDILVELAEYPPTTECVVAMRGLGYEPMGESGVSGRHWFRKGVSRTHHVHAAPVGGKVGRRQLALRDWLRRHPDDAQAYVEIKRTAAAMYPEDIDSAAYAQAKTAFVERILAHAQNT